MAGLRVSHSNLKAPVVGLPSVLLVLSLEDDWKMMVQLIWRTQAPEDLGQVSPQRSRRSAGALPLLFR